MGGLRDPITQPARTRASLPQPGCASTTDRIIHHADIITIEGQSYRRRAAEESAAARKTKAMR